MGASATPWVTVTASHKGTTMDRALMHIPETWWAGSLHNLQAIQLEWREASDILKENTPELYKLLEHIFSKVEIPDSAKV